MRLVVAATAALAILVACGGPPGPSDDGLVRVVTTTTVLADLVNEIGGDRVSVIALVPKGGDVHTFDPAPSDAGAVSRADLLVINGLGLDDWLIDFARNAGAEDGLLIKLADGISPVEYIDGNPHLWMNPDYAVAYADHIARELAQLDPGGQATYETRLLAWTTAVFDMQNWANAQFTPLTPEQRRIVSFHDAFPYFASSFGVEIVGVVVDAPGQDPTPAQMASLIDAIRASGVKVILAEAQFNPALAQTIAAETGAVVIQDLYTDTLGNPPADSYIGAMRWNVEQIVAALR